MTTTRRLASAYDARMAKVLSDHLKLQREFLRALRVEDVPRFTKELKI